ncbi:hypothetical protein FA15DRAFT_605744 [Coprinopsis marcescibilis]|uniref:Uncharacterized protein n=1 Tax=Coprinopsis marcescibilis TaxID=230819 RepID=A0A5C3KBH6_COPMA|nr:hypothetical protein FA15DRAFT_605744 [Coprinopsis marcescibilis]
MTSWPDFTAVLEEKLNLLPEPVEISSIKQFEDTLEALNLAVELTINKHVPETRQSPFTKRWWTKDLSSLRKTAVTLARTVNRHKSNMDHPSHKSYRLARNAYSKKI